MYPNFFCELSPSLNTARVFTQMRAVTDVHFATASILACVDIIALRAVLAALTAKVRRVRDAICTKELLGAC